MIRGVSTRLVSTGEAAKVVGVHVRTLQAWAKDGVVRPALVTPGGHQRWDVEDLLQQLRDQRLKDG
jgi:excisionase family DNA binding protein